MFCGCTCFGWIDILFVMLRLVPLEMAVHLAAANDVFGVVFPFKVSLVESGIELCQFLRIFLITFYCTARQCSP